MASKYKPILFSTEMVQAILEGIKTQTRRIVKNPMLCDTLNYAVENSKEINESHILFHQSQYKIGHILWVRESFFKHEMNKGIYEYVADYEDIEFFKNTKWKKMSSIHMPKKAARIFLEVTNVRVERLQDISEADAISEGVFFDKTFKKYDCYLCGTEKWHKQENIMCEDGFFDNPKESFQSLWESINGIDSWKANPWVWVYEFKVVEKPNDFLITNI